MYPEIHEKSIVTVHQNACRSREAQENVVPSGTEIADDQLVAYAKTRVYYYKVSLKDCKV
jgi:hypothetical protein